MTNSTAERARLEQTLLALEHAAASRLKQARGQSLVTGPDTEAIRHHLQTGYDFAEAIPTATLVSDVLAMLTRWDLDSTHPRYFGLFNPPALPVTVIADALVAMLNPQVGTRTHAPAANEIEQHVLRHLAERIGFSADECAAHFTSGGQEANATAMATALAHHFPSVPDSGVRTLDGQPRLYVSEHAHHSLGKAAKFTGLGAQAVREVPALATGAMDVAALEARITADRGAGDLPFLVVATAGTTGIGSIDPLGALAELAAREHLWLHVDAAWGGGALMSDKLRVYLDGIERADSVTWDAHKWLDVPMGAGMLFYQRAASTGAVFRVSTGYVPEFEGDGSEPYLETFQWSRRFIGLKLFMALASLSTDGYARLVEHQCAVAEELRARLREEGWQIVNDTPLPLVCFTHEGIGGDPEAIQLLVEALQARGQVWVSRVLMPDGQAAVRASITSYATDGNDLQVLLDELRACTATTEQPP